MEPTEVTITNLGDLASVIQEAIDGHTAAMTALTGTINDIFAQVLILTIVLVMVAVAYWHRERMLYILAGAGLLVLTVKYFISADDWYLAFILLIFSVYSFIKGFLDPGRRAQNG
jgi:hypothetical protein